MEIGIIGGGPTRDDLLRRLRRLARLARPMAIAVARILDEIGNGETRTARKGGTRKPRRAKR